MSLALMSFALMSHALMSFALMSHALMSHALMSFALMSHALMSFALMSLALMSFALMSHALMSHALMSLALMSPAIFNDASMFIEHLNSTLSLTTNIPFFMSFSTSFCVLYIFIFQPLSGVFLFLPIVDMLVLGLFFLGIIAISPLQAVFCLL